MTVVVMRHLQPFCKIANAEMPMGCLLPSLRYDRKFDKISALSLEGIKQIFSNAVHPFSPLKPNRFLRFRLVKAVSLAALSQIQIPQVCQLFGSHVERLNHCARTGRLVELAIGPDHFSPRHHSVRSLQTVPQTAGGNLMVMKNRGRTFNTA